MNSSRIPMLGKKTSRIKTVQENNSFLPDKGRFPGLGEEPSNGAASSQIPFLFRPDESKVHPEISGEFSEHSKSEVSLNTTYFSSWVMGKAK